MKIAIITGASSGLGVELYKELQKEVLDEIWVIARRENRLNELKEKFGKIATKVVAMDVTTSENMQKLVELLKSENPDVKFLINNAGFGTIGNLDEANYQTQGGIVNLNCRALTEITTIVLPYMSEKSYIVNICSIASFVPNARMTTYSATKAYVMSFTKSLRYELKGRKINVTAICPGPMNTEFLAVAGIEKGTSKTFDTLPRCNVEKTAKGGLKAAKKGRCVYTPHPFFKFYRVLAKILPHSWLMGAAKT
jgi:short-subunit dehydrogenase